MADFSASAAPPPLKTTPAILRVAIASPLRTLFDYLLPAELASAYAGPGQRVNVPFGRKQMTGIIIEAAASSEHPREKLRPVAGFPDQGPLLDKDLLRLYTWASDYYHYPIGMALQTGLPRTIRSGEKISGATMTLWQPTTAGVDVDLDTLKRAPRQQQVLACLRRQPDQTRQQLGSALDFDTASTLRTLGEKGLVQTITRAVERDFAVGTPQSPLTLNPEQGRALTALTESLATYRCHLLEGVTGSGKTEVYLQLIASVLQQKRQVLVLIPEIGLTPQTLARFEKRFGFPVTVVHSGLTETTRLQAWLDARSGRARLVIGTRSAIFLPLKNPGLIIVDEEHDPSFKQQDGFRYSARDLAIYRARQLNIPVLLGSATPSLESLNNALAGRYDHHLLETRTGSARLPDFHFIDLRSEPLEEGMSETLFTEIAWRLERGQQVLVFLNRRGYSPMLMCHDCGWVAECSRCETSYTLHRLPPALICHHCDSQAPLPPVCGSCGSASLIPMGFGTERVGKVLSQRFPDFPVIRVDRDTTRGRQAMQDIVDSVNNNQPCLLVGTQMLAKGHHFPGVTLVAILDADRNLFSTSFRGQEQLAQLITQVAGRAGREQLRGDVLIPTHHENHPLYTTLVNDGYGVLARQLLVERRAAGLPPFTFQALIHAESRQRQAPEKLLNDSRRELANLAPDISVLGPLPSPLEKKADRFRFQLVLQSRSRPALHRALSHLIGFIENRPELRKVRWAVDVDPLDFS